MKNFSGIVAWYLACVAGVLKGKRKGVLGKGVLGARETRGAPPFPSLSNACHAGFLIFSGSHSWHSFVEFKHFDKLNPYLKQQNCPCLRNWQAKLNCEGRIIAESRYVFHLEPLCGFGGRWFCLRELFWDQCYNSTLLLFLPSSVMIVLAFLSCLLVFFLR